MHVNLYFSFLLNKEKLHSHHMAFVAIQITQHLDLLERLRHFRAIHIDH